MTLQEFTQQYSFNLRKDKIGGGSFGTVYKAYDNINDIEIAIKVSEVKFVGDKEFSLQEEYNAIKNLPNHANIANYNKVYRFESFQGIFDYALMQYYPLGNLSNYLKNNKVSKKDRENLVVSILEGISFLHDHNVVHRDLKPSNILVVDRRGQLVPKITDFGLSKQANADAQASRFTNSFAGGTLQYSSPEQIKGLPLKLNTDLWSFGCIAYEILTSKTLFETESISIASSEWQNAISQQILHEDISLKLNVLDAKWQKVVKQCLERDFNKRIKNTQHIQDLITPKMENDRNDNAKTSQEADSKATIIKQKKGAKTNNLDDKTLIQNASYQSIKMSKARALELFALKDFFNKSELFKAYDEKLEHYDNLIKVAQTNKEKASYNEKKKVITAAFELLDPLAAIVDPKPPKKYTSQKKSSQVSKVLIALTVVIIVIVVVILKPWESDESVTNNEYISLKQQADKHYEEENYEEALKSYIAALDVKPDDESGDSLNERINYLESLLDNSKIPLDDTSYTVPNNLEFTPSIAGQIQQEGAIKLKRKTIVTSTIEAELKEFDSLPSSPYVISFTIKVPRQAPLVINGNTFSPQAKSLIQYRAKKGDIIRFEDIKIRLTDIDNSLQNIPDLEVQIID